MKTPNGKINVNISKIDTKYKKNKFQETLLLALGNSGSTTFKILLPENYVVFPIITV